MIENSNIFESYKAELIKLFYLIQAQEGRPLNNEYLLGKISNSLHGSPLILSRSLERKYLKYRKDIEESKNDN